MLPIDDPFPHLFEMREALVVIGSVFGYILLAGPANEKEKEGGRNLASILGYASELSGLRKG